MKPMDQLGVSIPSKFAYIIRNLKDVSISQRTRALQETEYNMFSFPADLVTMDFLSDSGTTSMSDSQWAALLHGDEAYGRNRGYYCLLDAVRDTFERGDQPKRAINLILSNENDVDRLMNDLYLTSYEGGFANGGVHQLSRPNSFICPQGRAAEYLLFSTLSEILNEKSEKKSYLIPNNGHFDTTAANIRAVGILPVNCLQSDILDPFSIEKLESENPFRGNMNLDQLQKLIDTKGSDHIPIIYLTITNNTAAGQPVSLQNIQNVAKIASAMDIPLFFDACRFAENAIFIKKFETGYAAKSIQAIVQEMFQYIDGFTISFKKDGLANMGGGLFLRDQGRFIKKYPYQGKHIGIRLKEKQILTFGNDSYGGLSGRDIMALSMGLQEVMKESYLRSRIEQVSYFARKLAEHGVPIILPPGGHAIYLDMTKFFEGIEMKPEDFGGVGFTIELLRYYGIRACELGPFAFEWDQRSEAEREGILNVVRFAIPRNAYSNSDLDYAVAAISELYRNREQIPKIRIKRGADLKLRHFQTGLEPIYPKSSKPKAKR